MARMAAATAAACLTALVAAGPTLAQTERPPNWQEVKCTRYKAAWTEALARRGRQGLGQDFVEAHEAFLTSGCTDYAKVCPRSPEEIDLANIMIIAAMNAGTASTFPPFGCR